MTSNNVTKEVSEAKKRFLELYSTLQTFSGKKETTRLSTFLSELPKKTSFFGQSIDSWFTDTFSTKFKLGNDRVTGATVTSKNESTLNAMLVITSDDKLNLTLIPCFSGTEYALEMTAVTFDAEITNNNYKAKEEFVYQHISVHGLMHATNQVTKKSTKNRFTIQGDSELSLILHRGVADQLDKDEEGASVLGDFLEGKLSSVEWEDEPVSWTYCRPNTRTLVYNDENKGWLPWTCTMSIVDNRVISTVNYKWYSSSAVTRKALLAPLSTPPFYTVSVDSSNERYLSLSSIMGGRKYCMNLPKLSLLNLQHWLTTLRANFHINDECFFDPLMRAVEDNLLPSKLINECGTLYDVQFTAAGGTSEPITFDLFCIYNPMAVMTDYDFLDMTARYRFNGQRVTAVYEFVFKMSVWESQSTVTLTSACHESPLTICTNPTSTNVCPTSTPLSRILQACQLFLKPLTCDWTVDQEVSATSFSHLSISMFNMATKVVELKVGECLLQFDLMSSIATLKLESGKMIKFAISSRQYIPEILWTEKHFADVTFLFH